MPEHSPDACRALQNLDDALARASEKAGQELHWTATEVEVREAIAATLDRRTEVAKMWEDHTDPKLRMRLSIELRQLNSAVVKLMKEIKPDVPPAPSLTSVKNARAANIRWQQQRDKEARGG